MSVSNIIFFLLINHGFGHEHTFLRVVARFLFVSTIERIGYPATIKSNYREVAVSFNTIKLSLGPAIYFIRPVLFEPTDRCLTTKPRPDTVTSVSWVMVLLYCTDGGSKIVGYGFTTVACAPVLFTQRQTWPCYGRGMAFIIPSNKQWPGEWVKGLKHGV